MVANHRFGLQKHRLAPESMIWAPNIDYGAKNILEGDCPKMIQKQMVSRETSLKKSRKKNIAPERRKVTKYCKNKYVRAEMN
jgi:hypothetical protein